MPRFMLIIHDGSRLAFGPSMMFKGNVAIAIKINAAFSRLMLVLYFDREWVKYNDILEI
jgi:hypothetical protein